MNSAEPNPSSPRLDDRVAREKAAYDHGSVYAESQALQSRFHHVFSCPGSRRAEQFFGQTVARLAAGQDMLDYGCYDGKMMPRYLSMKPRSITGLDISEYGIALARAQYGDQAQFVVGDAHHMPFPEHSFDLVVGRAILHHLELALALNEIRRVLRPGGRAMFFEPLGGNPGAKLIRQLTPKARTSDETPLSRHAIRQADKLFGNQAHRLFNLISVPAAMLTSLTPLSPGNLLLRLADRCDQQLERSSLRYWMQSVVLIWTRQ
jgi:ubiquinone/menaquinone biosynthesis C-methylase UbiE